MADEQGPALELDEEERDAMEKCGYSEEEALAFKQVYNHYDSNFGKGDGMCSVALMKTMVRALGINMDKPAEDKLAELLIECDENGDGATQFPEFLLLIKRMQEMNFCGVNDAAAARVKASERADEKKEQQKKRKEAERAAHRAEKDQKKLGAAGAAAGDDGPGKLLTMEKKGPRTGEDAFEDEEEPSVMTPHDPSGGPYQMHYIKHHKTILDVMKDEYKGLLALSGGL